MSLRLAVFLHFLAIPAQRAQSEIEMFLLLPVLSPAGTAVSDSESVTRGHWAEPCSKEKLLAVTKALP